jgi:hypothetical protein
LRGDAVIAGEDDDRRTRSPRAAGVLQTGQFDRKRLEPAERTGRFCQFALAEPRRLAMLKRDSGTVLSDPLGKHAICLQ